jgi:hypothetical protein
MSTRRCDDLLLVKQTGAQLHGAADAERVDALIALWFPPHANAVPASDNLWYRR